MTTRKRKAASRRWSVVIQFPSKEQAEGWAYGHNDEYPEYIPRALVRRLPVTRTRGKK